MSRKIFKLIYHDGSRKHITREERDSLLLSRQAKRTESGNYLFIGVALTLHSFAELDQILPCIQQNILRHFLPGSFVTEYPKRLGGKRVRELLETPEAMAMRLAAA